MKITLIDPETGHGLALEVNPAEVNQQEGWSVIMPNGQSIFITLYNGRWEGRNNKLASSELINAIGMAINPSSVQKSPNTSEILEDPKKNITQDDVDYLMRKVEEEEYNKKFP